MRKALREASLVFSCVQINPAKTRLTAVRKLARVYLTLVAKATYRIVGGEQGRGATLLRPLHLSFVISCIVSLFEVVV